MTRGTIINYGQHMMIKRCLIPAVVAAAVLTSGSVAQAVDGPVCQPLIGCTDPVVQPIIGYTAPAPVPTCCFVPILGDARYLYPATGTHY